MRAGASCRPTAAVSAGSRQAKTRRDAAAKCRPVTFASTARPREGAARREPPAVALLEPLQERRGAERREEEHVPGRHRRRVHRQRPDDAEDGERRRGERRDETRRDPEDDGDPERRRRGTARAASSEQVHPEHPEGPGVQPREAAGVRVVEVAMGHFAQEDALGGLRQRSLVVRDPALVEPRPGERERRDPERQENRPPTERALSSLRK